MNMSKNVKVTQVLGYYAAGTTKRVSDIIDMADYEGVMFVAELGTLLENGTIDVFVEANAVNSTVGMTRLATTTVATVTATQATYTKSCILVDVYQPTKRYIQANITPAVANAVILGITAIQYKGKFQPASNELTTLKATFLQSPAEV